MRSFWDLSRTAQLYITGVVLGGFSALLTSVSDLYSNPIDGHWFFLVALTLLSGSITIKLPSVPATLSVSEVFVFTSVLLFGVQAGTVIAALDGLVISFWLQRKGQPVYRIVFNGAETALSLWVSATAFFAIAGVPPLSSTLTPLSDLLIPLTAMAALYFLLNTSLIAIAIALEQRLSAYTVWRDNFPWVSLNYFNGASVAALVVAYTRQIELTILWIIVPILVISYLTYRASMGRVEDAHKHLGKLNSLYMSTVETLAMAIDAKDQITHGHIRRVQAYAVGLARVLGVSDNAQIKAIEAAALLHDMGKLAVPEYILNKPGKLTPAEFEKMKLHASVGADILSSVAFPYPVVPIVRHHHEAWNGTGYPDGLKGADIPIGARILAVVDCFDALTSDRPYRPRLPDADALDILQQRRGTMYDPLVVDKFLDVYSQISPREAPHSSDGPRRALTAISAASIVPPFAPPSASSLDQISTSAEEMLALYDLARSLRSDIGLQDLADLITKHLRRLLPPSVCAFFTYEESTGELVAGYTSGEGSVVAADLRIPLGQRITGWVAANRQTILNADPVLDLGDCARTVKPRLRSYLGTAVCEGDRLVGVISLYASEVDAFSEDHRRILEAVAGQVGAAIERALQFDTARQTLLRDTLTGLPNFEHLRRLFESHRHQPTSPQLAILLIDIDGLKQINEDFGRDSGDKILGAVATATRVALRSADVLFRLRSDEFVAVLGQSDEQALRSVADRVRSSIATAHHTCLPSREPVGVTVTWAIAPEDGISLEDLLSAARKRSDTERTARRVFQSGSASVH